MAVVGTLAEHRGRKTGIAETGGITKAVADFAVSTRIEAIPAKLFECATRSQLDTLGVTLGGVADDDAPRILAAHARDVAPGSGEASVIGQGFKTFLPYAALINGTAADVIGYSDVALETMNHPSPSVCAALWALGERTGASGRDILAAHVIGLEVAEKIGHAIRPKFQQKGWEPRGVLNTFGAAAACARLLGLDAETCANALGICGAEASGMRAVKGTMSKAYITGMAARNGLEAALLASRGYTGPVNVFEAKDGVLQTFGEGASGEGLAASLGDPWEYLDPGITYKRFPVCTCTHPAIEAALALCAEHGLKPDGIARVVCETTPGVADWLPFAMPEHKFQGKYSMPFAIALAVIEGDVTLKDVTDAKVRDPAIRAFMEKVAMTVWDEYAKDGYTPAYAPYGCRVTMTLKDGRTLVERRDNAAWEPKTPPAWDALAHKFKACAALVLSDEAVERAAELVRGMDKLEDIARLMDTVRG